jgi:hypothetical protein
VETTIDLGVKHVVTTIPIGANIATQNTTVDLGERYLDVLDVLFRPGHAGLTGVRVSYGGVSILPWNQPTQFLLGDNERRRFDIGLHVAGPLTVTTRNLDKGFAHVFDLTWQVRELQLASEPPRSIPLLTLVGP